MSLSPDQKLAAYLLGRRIAGQRRKQDRVPVAYLYNGVRLPGLPEWDKETYPYAVIVRPRKQYMTDIVDEEYCTDTYEVYISNVKFTFDESVGRIWYHLNPVEKVYSYCSAMLKEDGEMVVAPEWEEPVSTEYGYGISCIPVWSNYLITNNTDLYVPEPSEPVPVYE